MGHEKDISIGEDLWIEWKDFDVHSVEPLRIDELLKTTTGFWKRLETECVAECCGIDAFGFWSEDIQRAAKNTDPDTVQEELIKLRLKLSGKADEVIVSGLLNQLLAKEVFLNLIDHIIQNINESST